MSFAGVALAAWMCGVPSVRAQDSAVTLTESQNGASSLLKNLEKGVHFPCLCLEV
jgi:hypothetical protein